MSRSEEIVIDIKATQEEVFRAITEPEQIVKWFAPKARVDPRVGGEYCISWSEEMGPPSFITAYDPFTHFGAAKERFAYGPKGPVEAGGKQKIAVDYYIEALGDGVTRLRLVQSGFGQGAAWDDEIASIKTGWAEFLGSLKKLLEG